MRSSDWSSDVCSSDLRLVGAHARLAERLQLGAVLPHQLAIVERTAVVRGDRHRADRLFVAGIDEYRGRRDAGAPFFAPLPDRDHSRQQFDTLLRQLIAHLVTIPGHPPAPDDPMTAEPRP